MHLRASLYLKLDVVSQNFETCNWSKLKSFQNLTNSKKINLKAVEGEDDMENTFFLLCSIENASICILRIS
jgi:hypothetical protein